MVELFPQKKMKNDFFILNKEIAKLKNFEKNVDLKNIDLMKKIREKLIEVKQKFDEIVMENEFVGKRSKKAEKELRFGTLTSLKNIPFLFFIPFDSKKIMLNYLDEVVESLSVEEVLELIKLNKAYLLPDPETNLIFTYNSKFFRKKFDFEQFKKKYFCKNTKKTVDSRGNICYDSDKNIARANDLDIANSLKSNTLKPPEDPKKKKSDFSFGKKSGGSKNEEGLICFSNFGKYSFKFASKIVDEEKEVKDEKVQKRDSNESINLEESIIESNSYPDEDEKEDIIEEKKVKEILLNGAPLKMRKLPSKRPSSVKKARVENQSQGRKNNFKINRSVEIKKRKKFQYFSAKSKKKIRKKLPFRMEEIENLSSHGAETDQSHIRRNSKASSNAAKKKERKSFFLKGKKKNHFKFKKGSIFSAQGKEKNQNLTPQIDFEKQKKKSNFRPFFGYRKAITISSSKVIKKKQNNSSIRYRKSSQNISNFRISHNIDKKKSKELRREKEDNFSSKSFERSITKNSNNESLIMRDNGIRKKNLSGFGKLKTATKDEKKSRMSNNGKMRRFNPGFRSDKFVRVRKKV